MGCKLKSNHKSQSLLYMYIYHTIIYTNGKAGSRLLSHRLAVLCETQIKMAFKSTCVSQKRHWGPKYRPSNCHWMKIAQNCFKTQFQFFNIPRLNDWVSIAVYFKKEIEDRVKNKMIPQAKDKDYAPFCKSSIIFFVDF